MSSPRDDLVLELVEDVTAMRKELTLMKSVLNENNALLQALILDKAATVKAKTIAIEKDMKSHRPHRQFRFVNMTKNSYSDTGSYTTSVNFPVSDSKRHTLNFSETKTIRQAIGLAEEYLSELVSSQYYHDIICPGTNTLDMKQPCPGERYYADCIYTDVINDIPNSMFGKGYPAFSELSDEYGEHEKSEVFIRGDLLYKKRDLTKTELKRLSDNSFRLILH